MSEETVKTRDKQIKQAAYGWACSEETGYLGSNSFVQGARWADSSPAPSGKVLSEIHRERFNEIKTDFENGQLCSEDVYDLIKLVERLTEQPVRPGE